MATSALPDQVTPDVDLAPARPPTSVGPLHGHLPRGRGPTVNLPSRAGRGRGPQAVRSSTYHARGQRRATLLVLALLAVALAVAAYLVFRLATGETPPEATSVSGEPAAAPAAPAATARPAVGPTTGPASAGVPSPAAGSAAGAVPPVAASPAAGCAYAPELEALVRALGRPVVGDCLEAPRRAPNGNLEQRTARGLLVWNAARSMAAFTDGASTWDGCPGGPRQRASNQPPAC